MRRPYTFIVLALLLLIIGPLTILRTPVDILPSIDIPVVSTVWRYTGLASEEMEGRIVSQYERAMTSTVNGIEHIESQTTNGVGVVKGFFHPGASIPASLAQIVAIAQTVLVAYPPGTTPPLAIQALGWGADGKYKKLADDIASVAYWYQAEPHAPYPKLPPLAERLREAKRPPLKIPGAAKCELLELVGRSPNIVAEPQALASYGPGWSGDAQLFVQAKQVGDFAELAIPAKEAGAKKVMLYATRGTDYEKLRFTVNGKPPDVTFDGYPEKPAPSGPISLGVYEPKDGKFMLRAEVVGTNPASTGARYFFGLDAVVLDKP